MSIRDKETTNEMIQRQGLIGKELKRTYPIMLLATIFILAIGVVMYVTGKQYIAYGLGNPYECIKCKDAQMACVEHRYFKADKAIKDKIDKFTYNYVPDKLDSKQYLYGEGIEYNLGCDFCKSGETECYGCEYNRLSIQNACDKIYNEGILASKLDDRCWELGYANCSSCRSLLAQMIHEELITN